MEDLISSKESSDCTKNIRRSDCSTDIEGRFSLPIEFSRQSYTDQNSYTIFGVPITPKSDLFLQPNESPGYTQLNSCLQEFYSRLENEIAPSCFDDQNEKTVQVLKTSCSSLLQRRNKSDVGMKIKNPFRD